MSTLITGGRGVLGREFARLLPGAFAPASTELDVRDAQSLSDFFSLQHVDRVVHCAALTSVRYCEDNQGETFATNVQGTRNICRALSQAPGGRLVYVSTACVFPGDDPDACYAESDTPGPKNYYSKSKLLGESVVTEWANEQADRQALIIRTNFAERGPWKYPLAFVDRFGTYLYADQIASRVRELVQARETGIVHVCGDRRLSVWEFARLGDPTVGRTSLADYQGPPVTINMSLRSERIAPLRLE